VIGQARSQSTERKSFSAAQFLDQTGEPVEIDNFRSLSATARHDARAAVASDRVIAGQFYRFCK
jgi:hypothetical protein